eukprot:7377490-Prymnesium_polylepis.1
MNCNPLMHFAPGGRAAHTTVTLTAIRRRPARRIHSIGFAVKAFPLSVCARTPWSRSRPVQVRRHELVVVPQRKGADAAVEGDEENAGRVPPAQHAAERPAQPRARLVQAALLVGVVITLATLQTLARQLGAPRGHERGGATQEVRLRHLSNGGAIAGRELERGVDEGGGVGGHVVWDGVTARDDDANEVAETAAVGLEGSRAHDHLEQRDTERPDVGGGAEATSAGDRIVAVACQLLR